MKNAAMIGGVATIVVAATAAAANGSRSTQRPWSWVPWSRSSGRS